jgi:hypothetical protein
MKHDYSPGFLLFWDEYPRHEGTSRVNAAKSYERAITAGATHAEIMAGLKRYPFQASVNYQPHAATWLNQRRWEDPGADRTAPSTIVAPSPPPSRASWRDKYDGGGDPSAFFPATRQSRMDASNPFTIEVNVDD